MPYFLALTLALLACWILMVNAAKLATQRMLARNAADNAAVSAAVYRARTLNALGEMNLALARLLYEGTFYEYAASVSLGGVPVVIPLFPRPGSQKEICGYIDAWSGGGARQAGLIKEAVEAVSSAQEALASDVYPANACRLADTVAKLNGADGAALVRGCSLGLEPNRNGVIYHSVEKLDPLRSLAVRGAINAALAAAGVPANVREVYRAREWSRGKRSWLCVDKDNFDKAQKLTVAAVIRPDSPSNKGYPLFAKFSGTRMPLIYAAAAAAVYNTRGPMFPVKAGGKASDSVKEAIREYEKASGGGWDAHLTDKRW